jgi:hypothetical protein
VGQGSHGAVDQVAHGGDQGPLGVVGRVGAQAGPGDTLLGALGDSLGVPTARGLGVGGQAAA